MTTDGIARTKRIVAKLFHTSKITKVQLHIYTSVLPLLKKYVMIFQKSQTMIHVLNDKQIELISGFLSLFMKPEVLSNTRNIQDVKLDEKNHLKDSTIFLVDYIRKNLTGESANSMITTLKQAYVRCSQYLLLKMPINNALLKSLSALDPRCRGHSVSLKYLLRLSSLVKNVLSREEGVAYDLEVRKFVSSPSLPPYHNDDIVAWWSGIDKEEYPILTRMAFALLSCFHAPEVESSFSLMQQVMHKGIASLHVRTFAAIQTVKYELNSSNKSAIQYFDRDIHGPINPQLCRNMKVAYKHHQQHKEEVNEKKEEKRKDLGFTEKPAASKLLSSKTKTKLLSFRSAHSQIKIHQEKAASKPNQKRKSTESNKGPRPKQLKSKRAT